MTTTNLTREPLFNVPPLTLLLTALLVAVFLCTNFFPLQSDDFIRRAVFVPATLQPSNSYTLLSYALLHFGWLHILMNGCGLLAFGSAIERLTGKKFYLLIFLGGIIIGALGHWALFPDSVFPLGGASAGVSALLGAALPFLVGRKQLLPTNIVFILSNIALGWMGMPNSAPLPPGEQMTIAWQAHLFGFAFGEIVGILILKYKSSRFTANTINPQL